MKLLSIPNKTSNGCYHNITPEVANWKYVGFKAYDLSPQKELTFSYPDVESCLIILSGIASITVDGQTFSNVGERMSVFEDKKPHAVYAPNGSKISITALTDVELALATAPGFGNHPARWIKPEDMESETRGSGSNTRHICNILPEKDKADSLLLVEVKTPAGNWSSYPPHKHENDNPPEESLLEEIYYHRIDPSQGFVFQRVYTDDLSIDETMSVADKNVVMVPRGYHPVGVPYGYDSYYLNVMAGPKRNWIFKNHPDHSWILKK
jgi:5-deoxy-glucuronate isomerase